MANYEFGIVGLGPAGCIFLACLPEEKLKKTVVFDSGCVGGDLSRYYGNVIANLTRAQLCNALRGVPQWKDARLPILENGDTESCPKLSDLCKQLRELMKPILSMVTLHSQHIDLIQQTLTGWRLGAVEVAKVIICTGGVPRTLDYPRPAIPLEIALDGAALASYINPVDRVVVFGTAHSGTLILRNLRDIGCTGVVAVYRGAGPAFRWATPHTPDCPCPLLGGTGCHDSEGVKQESAKIAGEIVRGEWGSVATPRLISTNEIEALTRAVISADYVVYSVGFHGRFPRMVGLGGTVLDVQKYDAVTGVIAPGAWGFGLAFPSMYEKPQGGQAPDIGFPGFVGHILKCLPAII